ncbi:MAG: hypothetical protein WHX52_03510 [Anaerolineae bacterium]
MTKKSKQTPPKAPQRQKQAEAPVTRGWGKQLAGAAIGMLLAAIALQIGPSLGWPSPANTTMVVLMGGAIGATVLTLDRFEQAGSRLTRRTEGAGVRIVNVLLGLLGLFVVISLIWMVAYSVGWLIEQF